MNTENLSELAKNKVYCGDVLDILKTFPGECVDLVMTSPPYYGLRNYQVEGQIGLEETFEEYLEKMLAVTAELKRVLKPTGVMFWNHGDCYGGSPTGSLPHPNPGFKSIKTQQAQIEARRVMANKIGQDKCLLMQPERLAIRMIDDDGDDIYGLKKELDNDTILAIMEEIGRHGYENKTTTKTIQNAMGAGMEKEESSKEKGEMEKVSGGAP